MGSLSKMLFPAKAPDSEDDKKCVMCRGPGLLRVPSGKDYEMLCSKCDSLNEECKWKK